MTDQTTNEMTDEQRAAMDEQARLARLWATEQKKANDQAEIERRWKNPGSLDRKFVTEQCGFDPGW